MDYVFEVSTGRFFKTWLDEDTQQTHETCVCATAYSGFGIYKNNVWGENLKGLGPIPRGDYMIGDPHTSSRVGPVAMKLIPLHGETFGRSDFLIHGDSRQSPGAASHGCVILPRNIREEIGKEVLLHPLPVVLHVR